MGVGIVVGSWPIPIAIAVSHNGMAGIRQIPTESHVLAHIPPVHDMQLHTFLEWANFVPIFAALITLGLFGIRVWRRLVIKKGWMTEEEVKRFEKRQYM
jgi:hypothetical protein